MNKIVFWFTSSYIVFYYLNTDDWKSHTKCISEAERYEKTMYRGNSNKKKNPAELWKDLIAEAADSAPSQQLRDSFQMLVEYDNVPRKQKQFLLIPTCFKTFSISNLGLNLLSESQC